MTSSSGRWINPHLRETEGIDVYMEGLRGKVFQLQICGFSMEIGSRASQWSPRGRILTGVCLTQGPVLGAGRQTILVLHRLS